MLVPTAFSAQQHKPTRAALLLPGFFCTIKIYCCRKKLFDATMECGLCPPARGLCAVNGAVIFEFFDFFGKAVGSGKKFQGKQQIYEGKHTVTHGEGDKYRLFI